ncbi:hypothetical protein BGZ81_007538 [Podila clonocystis]|nr:hypothetical protein BGZ81_007538 [Podila clonocystis]
MFSTNTSSTSSRTSSHSFLDPSALDFDLPPANPPNHITTIHEDSEEEEADYIHIHANQPCHHQEHHHHYHAQQQPSPASYDEKHHHINGSIPFDNSYPSTPPNRSAAASPALPSYPSPYYTPPQQSPAQYQQQQQTRYQYPRTRSGQASGGLGQPTGLPLYASRTQRMRNGHSSSVDQSGKPVFRGPQPRISNGIGGLSSGSDSDEDADYFIGGRGAGGIGHRLSSFRSRRGLPWYQSREIKIVGAILFFSLVVRLWKIGYPTSVVFDEVHFGGFASKYIRGRFFMDVHPPLAKMLIALTGFVFGLDPSFDFAEIGMDYLAKNVPYVAMRMMCGLMGVAVVPMAYYTIKNSGHSLHASILAAVLVLFENSIVTQSRLILLDSPLIFFTAFTTLAWVNFHNQRKEPFSDDWLIWLFMTGLGLGLAGSVKWVGLFIIATIGTSTLNQLWLLWGDLKVTPRLWVKHFMARAFCLILVPILVYMFMFEIHFLILGGSGDGDGFMSAPFQMTLGQSLKDSPLVVAYGATITIRHQGTQGGYLHSHPHNYETGSKQQQITLYPHKDTNNEWIIMKRDGTIPESLEYVKHGDYVRLMHVPTSKKLHSHNQKAPVSEDENHFEVSGYGGVEFPVGDNNDDWRVEIVGHDGSNDDADKTLHTLRSKFKLVHVNMFCDLFSHSVKLPKWAFEQQEVTCMRSAVLPKATWMIESNAYSKYPSNVKMVNYKKPGFLGKFLELNQVMWRTNAGLTDSHPYDSRPSSWFWLRRGISFWGKDQKHIYLIGNWFTWYLSSFSIVLYATIRVLLVVRDKRGYRDNFRGLREYYELSGGFFFMAWFYHYIPFFLMGRQLFLHHYLPALYFAILLLCVTFDLACRFIPNKYRMGALVLVSTVAILVFRARAPLAYGSEWTRSQCEASKILKTWDYDCWQYPEAISTYRANEEALRQQMGRIVDPTAREQKLHNGDKPHDFLEHVLPHKVVEPEAGGKKEEPVGVVKEEVKEEVKQEKKEVHGDVVEATSQKHNVIVEEHIGEGGDDEDVEMEKEKDKGAAAGSGPEEKEDLPKDIDDEYDDIASGDDEGGEGERVDIEEGAEAE